MAAMKPLILFGTRSPLIVDLEETVDRLGGIALRLVRVAGASRALNRALETDMSALGPMDAGSPAIACAFGPERRAELVALAQEHRLGVAPALIDPTAIIARSAHVGDGSYVNAAAVIGGRSMLGEHVFVNRSASVGHHCMIEDYVSIGPGAVMAGNVRIGERAVIATGARILPDVSIGEDAVVAAGAVVRHPVPAGTMVAGVPARPVETDRARALFGDTGQE